MIGNHKDTNKYPINLLIINYLYNFFRPYNYFLSIFKQLLKLLLSDKFFLMAKGADSILRSQPFVYFATFKLRYIEKSFTIASQLNG